MQKELEEKEEKIEQVERELNIVQESSKTTSVITIDLKNETLKQLKENILKIEVSEKDKIEITGDGSCTYRAILVSLEEKEDFMLLRNQVAEQILKDGVAEDIYLERNCESLLDYADHIRLKSFYADEPELITIAKLKKIWIAIYNELRKNWNIIKNNANEKPRDIAFISFTERKMDLSDHYETINIKKIKDNIDSIIELKKKKELNLNYSNKIDTKTIDLKILTWNARSLFNYIKKNFFN